MTWRLLVCSKEEFFLTSDNPLWFDEEKGIGNQQLDVSFPISSDSVLVIARKTDKEGVFRAGTRVVDEVDRRSATRATKYLYGCRPEAWVVKLMGRTFTPRAIVR